MSQARVIHVDIQGHRYAIKSELDAKYIGDIAAYVDQRMERVGSELATTDSLRLAVIAALNIADELFRARQERSGAATQLLARAADIERIVDAALDAASADVKSPRVVATTRAGS